MTEWEKIVFAVALALFVFVLARKPLPAIASMQGGAPVPAPDAALPFYLTYNQGFTGSGEDVVLPSNNVGLDNANPVAGSSSTPAGGGGGGSCNGCSNLLFIASGRTQL